MKKEISKNEIQISTLTHDTNKYIIKSTQKHKNTQMLTIIYIHTYSYTHKETLKQALTNTQKFHIQTQTNKHTHIFTHACITHTQTHKNIHRKIHKIYKYTLLQKQKDMNTKTYLCKNIKKEINTKTKT